MLPAPNFNFFPGAGGQGSGPVGTILNSNTCGSNVSKQEWTHSGSGLMGFPNGADCQPQTQQLSSSSLLWANNRSIPFSGKGPYNRRQGQEMTRRDGFGQKRQSRANFSCDACNRSYCEPHELEAHRREHIKCGWDGCHFEAHAKIVESHQKMQHYRKDVAKKIMSLDSPEDIKRWREERRKNFPTAEKAAQDKAKEQTPSTDSVYPRKRQHEERHSDRGFRGKNQRYSNNYNNRGRGGFNQRRNTQFDDRRNRQAYGRGNQKPTDMEMDKSQTETFREREATQELKKEATQIADEFDYKATKVIQLETSTSSGSNPVNGLPSAQTNANDSEPEEGEIIESEESIVRGSQLASLEEVAKPALSLVADYGDDSDEAAVTTKVVPKEPLVAENSLYCVSDVLVSPSAATSNANEGGEAFGSNSNGQKNRTHDHQQRKSSRSVRFYPRRREPTLFEKLLLNDVRRNEEKILDCIQLIVDNNFFDDPQNK